LPFGLILRLPRGANGGRTRTSKTPRTRLWEIRLFGDEDSEFEEYDTEELVRHLSRAHNEGARSPAPEAGSEQLTAFPNAHAAAAAEEEYEGEYGEEDKEEDEEEGEEGE
jgi:hypothetical protein